MTLLLGAESLQAQSCSIGQAGTQLLANVHAVSKYGLRGRAPALLLVCIVASAVDCWWMGAAQMITYVPGQ